MTVEKSSPSLLESSSFENAPSQGYKKKEISPPTTKKTAFSFFSKRLFDLIFSGLFLLLGSPIYISIALLVKLSSRGPIFYKGLRLGKEGKLFYCWKFRTMVLDASERLQTLLASDPELEKEWKEFHKLKKDPRLTRIGSFLRKTSLDELPQFWNVFKGDLSVVGPRPIEVLVPARAYAELEEKYGDKTAKILSIKPGVTCIWQISGRNHLTLEERAQLEEKYVDIQSFLLDLKIIAKTAFILLFPKGAY